MSAPARCPDPRLLQQLLLGRLPEDVAARLEQHVEQCPRCARLLPTLQAEDSLVETVRAQGAVASKPVDKGAVQGLIPRLQGLRADVSTAGPAIRTMQGPAGAVNNAAGPGAVLYPAQVPGEIGRLGPYRVLKVLGQGGMGAVYLAEDALLQRTVALKVMLPEVAKRPGAKERFLREARLTAKIEHDHIVTIYQVGEDHGVPYLAMQLLKGMSLEDLLKKKREDTSAKPLTLDQILRVGREIARGLAAAHEHGLIHRDIKPANIWLDALTGGRVKILDFGLARAAEGEAQQLTQFGTVVGTAAYMAPEQAQGKKVDGRADLFSLGCVLYRLSTGRMPWLSHNTMELLIAVSSEEPPHVHTLNPNVPPALAGLVMQLLAKRAEERPASAKAVVEAIQAIERDQPTQVMARLSMPMPVAIPVPAVTVCEGPTTANNPAVRSRHNRARSRSRPLLYLSVAGGLTALAVGAALVVISTRNTPLRTEVAVLSRPRDAVFLHPKEPKETRPRHPLDTAPIFLPPDTHPKEPTLDTRPPDSVKYLTNSIGMKFAPVRAGEFLMGTSAEDFQRFKKEPAGYNAPEPHEGPQHKVKLTKEYYISAFLVTQNQYEKVMGTNPSANKESKEHPVDTVNWHDAVEFCKRLSALPEEKKAGRVYRLPTEAEWEYACRAGSASTTAYGPTLSSRQANIDGDRPLGNTPRGPKIGKSVKVGSYPPNAWGLYDMHGNLWQWCQDGPRTYTEEAVEDPVGPNTSGPKNDPVRVLRGGSWREGGVSASYRKPRDPTFYRMNFIGIRVVLDP